jgi:hypothetical protein
MAECFTCGTATPCPNPVEPRFSRLMTALTNSSLSFGLSEPASTIESMISVMAP